MHYTNRNRNLLLGAMIILSLGFLVSCELSEPQPAYESSNGFDISLMYPPTESLDLGKAPADEDTVRAWLFQLGSDVESAFLLRPSIDDTSFVPAAFSQAPFNMPLILELTTPIEEFWWRLFVASDTYVGNTTFRLNPIEQERSVSNLLIWCWKKWRRGKKG